MLVLFTTPLWGSQKRPNFKGENGAFFYSLMKGLSI